MKKIEKAQLFLSDHLHLFRCPVCEAAFTSVRGNQLSCVNAHHFDLSKKGTLYFLLKPVQSEYTRDMLLARQRIAQSGFWTPLLDVLTDYIANPSGVTLDVGCGEGSHSHFLKQKGLNGPVIAFDISKEGINLGAASYEDIFFLVADLAHSPFGTKQYDTILNILSPSNYSEFKRLLKKDGQVIKVVPGENYLKELRAFQPNVENQTYSNENVVKKFEENFPSAKRYNVNYTVELDSDQITDFISMTPLGWHIDMTDEVRQSLRSITVDLLVLICD